MSENGDIGEVNKSRPFLLRLLFAKVSIPFDFIILIIGLTVVLTFYVLVKVPRLSVFINPEIETQNEQRSLAEKVSKLISLPENEKPLVITIMKGEDYKDLPFFSKVENGDKILLYVKSNRAILYRPNENIIIEVGQVNIDQ